MHTHTVYMYIYIYIYIHTHTHTHTHIYMYIYRVNPNSPLQNVPTLLGLAVVAVARTFSDATTPIPDRHVFFKLKKTLQPEVVPNPNISLLQNVPTLLGLAVVAVARTPSRNNNDVKILPDGLQKYVLKLREWAGERIGQSTRQRPPERATYGDCPKTPYPKMSWIQVRMRII